MAATRQDISRWFDTGHNTGGITHMIVVCDMIDWEDYPIYVPADQDVKEVVAGIPVNDSALKIMEVYSYAVDKERQMNMHRAWFPDE